jgi:chromosome segregation ATPase
MYSGATKSDNTKSLSDSRKELRVKILQLQTDNLQKKMDDAMDDIERMTHEYTTLIAELKVLNNVSESQNNKHIELLSRMIGEHETIPVDYDSCNTSEEMLQLVMSEISHVEKLETKMKEHENTALPDVGDNSEIWDRIALAQKAVKEEEEKMLVWSSDNPLAVLSKKNEDIVSPTRPPTPTTDFDSDSDTSSLCDLMYVNKLSNSAVV